MMKKLVLFIFLPLLVSSAVAQNSMPTHLRMQNLQTLDNRNRDTHWQPIDPPGSTGMTATLIGYVEIDSVEQRSPQLEVGIFHDDQCRGADFVNVYIPNQDRYFLYCSFFGLNGEEDHFRIYDHATETELDVYCPQIITYTDNATFGLPDPYLISFMSNHFEVLATANPEVGGTITGAGVYGSGETATLSATANYGYLFANWEKDGIPVSTNSSFSFTVTTSTAGEYVANFDLNSFEITATANPTAGGTIEGVGVYDYGATATLTAIPTTGYHFLNWTKDESVVSTSNIYSFVVEGPANLVAHFQLNSYEIAATAIPSNGGTISGTGTYSYGQTATLTIIPNENFVFLNWTENGEILSENPTFSFTVLNSRNLEAHLQLVEYLKENQDININIYPNPASTKLTIEASQTIDKWEIFNTSGVLLYHSNGNCDNIDFLVYQLTAGTYIIRLSTENTVSIRKFVKK